ncbi:MAG: HAMP domain-containing histidine kinase [Lachnospiraceae bacterium]|nr:HAMP domain-containing histidine kinase [Lachnospiraceae bacterium]
MKPKESRQSLQVKLSASLTYRIAVSFAILFLAAGLFLLAVFGLIRLQSVYEERKETAEEFLYGLTKEEADTGRLTDAAGALSVYSVETGEEVYRLGETVDRWRLGKWSLRKESGDSELFVRYKTTLVLYGAECEAIFVFDCTDEGGRVLAEMLRFGLWYLLLAALATVIFYAIQRAALRPIDEMSEQVNRLNLQNIHAERLNVEGTKDELKALATGINRMLDRMEASYEAQKQFVSEASHELRTPITVLQGYSSMLRRWGADDKEVLAESVEAIESEAKSMQDLVEKLLFLSRHERRKLPFAKERFDMAEVVRELEKEMVYLSDTRNVQCTVCEPVKVYGDKQLLKQALRVFLDNAVKYTKEGDMISISCRNRSGACEITIEDTGLGMRKEDLEGIFGRFFRADTVRGKNIEGHGLGLSIARLIIDGHAGKILVKTQYTKGSSFTITLPRQRGV